MLLERMEEAKSCRALKAVVRASSLLPMRLLDKDFFFKLRYNCFAAMLVSAV